MKVIEQGKHCGVVQPPGGRDTWSDKGHQKRDHGPERVPGISHQAHTNFLGEKALEPLESSEKDKRTIHSEP